jgi:hypothetical protein
MIRLLYRRLGLNWDRRALRRGRYPQRVIRRQLYRASGRAIRRLFRP